MPLPRANNNDEDDSLLAKVCTRTTCHGWLDFYQSKGWSRLFWFLITSGAFGAIGYYTYQTVDQYLQKQTATSIMTISQDQLIFPNVTICNPSRLNATFVMQYVNLQPDQIAQLAFIGMTELDFKRQFVRYLRVLSLSPEVYDSNDPNTVDMIGGLQQYYENMFNKSVNPNAIKISDFLKAATFECDKYLIQCQFGGQVFNCCDKIRMPFTDNGFCYTLDMNQVGINEGYQTAGGEEYGLDVVIQMNKNDLLIINELEEIGIRVHVVDYATSMDFNPVGVPTNMHAHIRLNPLHYVFDPDVDNCLPNGKSIEPFETYTQTLCEAKCLDDLCLEVCQCQNLDSFVDVNDTMVCSPLEVLQCIYPMLLGTSNNSAASMAEVSTCYDTQCPKTCDYWMYSTYVMYSELGDDDVMQNQFSSNNDTITIRLTVYFGSLQYDEYTEQLLTDVNTFISNLGGVVGLWTGISVVTILQCMAIIVFGPCEEKAGLFGF